MPCTALPARRCSRLLGEPLTWLTQSLFTSLVDALLALNFSVCRAAAGDVLGVLLYLDTHPEQLHNRTIFQSEVPALPRCPPALPRLYAEWPRRLVTALLC